MLSKKPGPIIIGRPATKVAEAITDASKSSQKAVPQTPAGLRPIDARTRSTPSAVAVIESLRGGGALDAAKIAAVAEALNARFEVLRTAWAGKKYFSPAVVFMSDDSDPNDPGDDNYIERYLAFRKVGKEWNFFLEEQHCRDQDGETATTIPLSSAPLEVRLEAVDALPKLEEALKNQSESLRKKLVAAYDGLNGFIERSLGVEREN